ncbi:MAG: aldolase [Clostridia bacterium]|nr:aldolase [Clostridia bacterium]
MLKLMYITNDPEVAVIAEESGVDRIFVDLEYIGKQQRQGGMDTVQNHHTAADVKNIRNAVKKAEVLVRVNPIHSKTDKFMGSETEINRVIDAGADVIMLPYFKTKEEVDRFLEIVDERARTILLFETAEAIDNIDEILKNDKIDEVFIGLNDLSLSYGQKFMFEPLADGKVDAIIDSFKGKSLPYGFGGIASLGRGMLPSEKIIAEHYRLGSTCVILSRSFCNTNNIDDYAVIKTVFNDGVKQIREYEKRCQEQNGEFFDKNRRVVRSIVNDIRG